jgi:hypothetical protein
MHAARMRQQDRVIEARSHHRAAEPLEERVRNLERRQDDTVVRSEQHRRRHDLNVKPDFHDVTVNYFVILTFNTKLASIT